MEQTAVRIDVKWLDGPAPDAAGACEAWIRAAVVECARATPHEGRPLLVCIARSGTWQCEAVYADKTEDCTSNFREAVNMVLRGDCQL